MIYSASGSDSHNCLSWEFFWSVHESTDWQQCTICHHQAFKGSHTVSSAACLILLSPVYFFYVSLWLCQSKLHFINLLIRSIYTAEIILVTNAGSLNTSEPEVRSSCLTDAEFSCNSGPRQSLTSKLWHIRHWSVGIWVMLNTPLNKAYLSMQSAMPRWSCIYLYQHLLAFLSALNYSWHWPTNIEWTLIPK